MEIEGIKVPPVKCWIGNMMDPIRLAEEVEKTVSRGRERKYYRFRPAKFYGGIATADVVGCNLRCNFCWSKKPLREPGKTGSFYFPEEVAEKLISIARKNNFKLMRISGNEPTIARGHLLSVLDNTSEFLFILETNGILIGHDPDYARELSRFSHLHVRVALKGTKPQEFSKLTNAAPEFFGYQLKALENLVQEGVSCHPALISLAGADREKLFQRLREISPGLEDVEVEPLITYPHVKQKLKEKNLL